MPQFAPTSIKQREVSRLSRITGEVSFSHSRKPDQNTRWPIASNSVGNHRHFHPFPYIVNGSSVQRQGKNLRTAEDRRPRWHAQVIDPRKGCRISGKPRAFSSFLILPILEGPPPCGAYVGRVSLDLGSDTRYLAPTGKLL